MYKKEYLAEFKRFVDLVQEGDTVVDIGANVGFLSIPAAQKSKTGTLIAVEAHPRTFGLLKENIEKNKLSNIKYFNLAVGDKAGVIFGKGRDLAQFFTQLQSGFHNFV